MECTLDENYFVLLEEDDEMIVEFWRIFAFEDSTLALVEVPMCDALHINVPTDPTPFMPYNIHTWPNKGSLLE